MSLSKRYSPSETESKWYAHWMEHNYFHSEPDEREAYTIVIPPPNVTGVLHMGHMLNNTIQDIYIRKARLEGKNACWVPGTDHASIATEAKVVHRLREKGIRKSDISREEFLRHAFEWKAEYGGIILDQLKRLGASCDWERTRFTMEESLSRAVIKAFVDLYRKGRLYRGLRITNWDPEALTVLSNEEVLYAEEQSRLFHINYRIEGGDENEFVTIATTRPETLLGDTAVAVHPDDERYAHLRGKRAIVPLCERAVPIIFDTYVESDFGTGALKVTPAHDANDYEIGHRHGLEVIDVFHPDGTMSEAAGFFVGEDRFEVRRKIVRQLQDLGHIDKIEDYRNKVGRSERTNAVVEPRLTEQWFLKMDEFATTALEAVSSGDVRFYPEHFWNMYNSWLREENVRDWCISRQLWWGQRIPAWYYKEHVIVAETPEEALEMARKQSGNNTLTLADLKQDDDVVDTWFSSWLWPLTVFDGFDKPDELRYYYPTNLLVTGWDIMFFWVARMIMAGYEWAPELLGPETANKKGIAPFHEVFFTGMVRDNKRRKMSKSLGNSPDALALIDRYGADGVRFGMLSSASAGNDIIFDAPFDEQTGEVRNESKACEQGLNFCNKMWNALRLIQGWPQDENTPQPLVNALAVKWLTHKLAATTHQLNELLREYRLSDAIISLYTFIWDDFCSWYLEMIKPAYGQPIDETTRNATIGLFEQMMTILHPFMPFVTEEIWHQLRQRKNGEDCTISAWPAAGQFDEGFLKHLDIARDVVSKLRDLRNKNGIKMSEALDVYVQLSESTKTLFEIEGLNDMVCKLGNLKSLSITAEDDIPNTLSFISDTGKYFVAVEQSIDTEAECARLKEDLAYQQGFVRQVLKKLENERFVSNAPEQVVANERKKLADGQERIKILEESIRQLGCE